MMQVVAPQPPTPPAFEQLPVIVDTGPTFVDVSQIVAMTIFLIGAIMLLLPLVRAWARRIEGRGIDPALADEIAAVRERVGEMDQLNARVHELEERLDFAERLLVQRDAVTPPRIEGQH